MAIVTSVKPQRNGKRVNIYLDDKFGFGLDLETYVKSGIKVEEHLTKEEVEKIVREGEFQKTYGKLLRYAALRPRSEKEFRDYLKKHKVHDSLHPKLFENLKHLDFLNDEKFARWWVDSRLTFKKKGPVAIKNELLQKGIGREMADEILAGVLSDDQQIENAKKVLEQKRYRWEKLEGFERRKKISEILMTKGYGWDLIRKLTNIDD